MVDGPFFFFFLLIDAPSFVDGAWRRFSLF
jgi:hypothetical protein